VNTYFTYTTIISLINFTLYFPNPHPEQPLHLRDFNLVTSRKHHFRMADVECEAPYPGGSPCVHDCVLARELQAVVQLPVQLLKNERGVKVLGMSEGVVKKGLIQGSALAHREGIVQEVLTKGVEADVLEGQAELQKVVG
jgi:hypothetical protein